MSLKTQRMYVIMGKLRKLTKQKYQFFLNHNIFIIYPIINI